MNIQELYSEESKRYDTRKVINRAGNAKIDPEFFDMLRKDGLTSEYIESFPYPVYKYFTQITLHGIFPANDLDRITVGGYQNVIVNKNGPIGIKYNAIDYEKKKRIGKYLKPYGFSYYRDSSGDEYSKAFIEKRDALADYNRIDVSNYYATKTVMYNPFTGRFYVRIYLKAIFEREVWSFIKAITGDGQSDVEQRYEQAQKDQQKREADLQAKYKSDQEERRKETQGLLEQLKDRFEPQINHLPVWDGKFSEGMILIRAGLISWQSKPGFWMCFLQKKAGWFQGIKSEHQTPFGQPRKTAFDKNDKVSERTEKELADQLTAKGKLRWYVMTGPARYNLRLKSKQTRLNQQLYSL